MSNPKIKSQNQIVVGPDADAFHFVDTKGNVIGWIDGTGTLQGNLVTTTGGNTTNIQGGPISPVPPAPNQILAWNGTTWLPTTPLSPNTNSTTIQGNPIAPTVPQINQALVWNGSAWTPGTISGVGNINFADAEVPSGTIDGINSIFSVLNAPTPPSSLQLFINGVLQAITPNGRTITLAFAPQIGDTLEAFYRY